MQSSFGNPRRKKLRLEGYDYSQRGYYHIVIVTKERIQVFGNIIDDQFISNEFGDQVTSLLSNFSNFHPEVEIELFQVMPNHVHLLLHIVESENQQFGRIIGAFKSFTNRLYRESLGEDMNGEHQLKLWQRGYFDHIIRSDFDLEETWRYIESNPLNWVKDEEILIWSCMSK